MMSGMVTDDHKKEEDDNVSEEEDDVSEEDDDLMAAFIISESDGDSSPPPRCSRRKDTLVRSNKPWDGHDVLICDWTNEDDELLKRKSIDSVQDASNTCGKGGVPNKMMSDAEFWTCNFGGRMLAPGEDAFKEGIGPLPDTLVNVQKPGEDSSVGVVREVLPDGSYKVAMGSDGKGDILIALPKEIKVVPPMKSDKVKIIGGAKRGDTGKLVNVCGSKGFVEFDRPLSLGRVNMKIVAKLVHV